MKHTINQVLIATAAIAAGALGLQAKTVAWYHFNEGANGTTLQGGQPVVLNAVDPTKLPGKPYVATGKAATSETGNNLPAYTNDMPSCVSWYDPVTGARGSDSRNLFLKTNNRKGSYGASTILIDDDEALHCQNITVEMMIKASPEAVAQYETGDWIHALSMVSDVTNNKRAWGIMIRGAGEMFCYMENYKDSSKNINGYGGSSYFYSTWVSSGAPKITDGKWHHIAMTYDGETVRLYVDYTQQGSCAYAGPIAYNDDCKGKLSIGPNYANSYGGWDGFIDELRISDEALQPAQFIRSDALSEKRVDVTDQDTAVYLPFDSMAVCNDPLFGNIGSPIVFNEVVASNAPIVKAILATDGILPTVETSAIVTNTMHSGVFATNSVGNGGCWKFGENSTAPGKSVHLTVDDYSMNANAHLISSGDFTIEFWLNVPSTPSRSCYIIAEMSKTADVNATAQPGTLLIYTVDNGVLRCRLVSDSELDKGQTAGYQIKYVDMDASGVFDGQWHHVALVVDRTNKTAAFYVDYKAVGTSANFVLASRVANTATYKPLEISGGWGPNRTDEFHNLSIDELRITRRALAPQEFLMAGAALDATTREELATGSTREWIGFEGDLSVRPSEAAVPDGKSTATTVSITYSADVPGIPGGKLLDGNGNVIREANTSSMYFSNAYGYNDTSAYTGGQKLTFERNVLLEKDMKSMTVEFFMKGTKNEAKAWASIVRGYCNANCADTEGQRMWGIGYKNASGNIYTLMDANGKAPATLHYPDDTVSLADGRWHHVAVTYEPDGNGDTLCKVYRDYKQLGGAKTFTGELEVGDHGMSSIAIGACYNGYIDEVRVSKGVLTFDQMLHVEKPGMMILIR